MKPKHVLELTLAIIKPDAMKQPHAVNGIRNLIVEREFFVVRSKIGLLSIENARRFYEEHQRKFFFNRLVTFMTSGKSQFLILAKENAIADWRKLMGPTKVYQAMYTAPDSIRGSFGLSDTRNATHGSGICLLHLRVVNKRRRYY